MDENHNIEIVKSVYDNFKTGNIAAICDLLADDFVMIMPGVEDKVPFAGTFKGPRGFQDYCKKIKSTADVEIMDVERFLAQGNRVDSHIHESWTIRETGKSFSLNTAHAWELTEDGKIKSCMGYNDTYAVSRAFIKG